ncbi:MAG TPA: VWA domain-containing protein [Arachnia sp.]|nr:VWA domain-containing protein [Arachnia sp.]
MRPTFKAIAALAITALALGAGSFTANADETGEDTKILLVLDASGSMKGDDPSGTTKLKAAKKALTTAISALPDDAQVGLRVYGATYPGKDKKKSCVDTQLAHPITPLDAAGLTTQINAVKAQGDTPIAYSLEKAIDDLGTEGKRHIILVSDGEENCDPDPCAVVKKLVDKDVSIQVDTVGYAVDKKARSQLRCIADAGKGTYYDAADADILTSTLSRLSTRALRAFTVQGTPVEGTPTPDDAPLLAVGQYTDTMPVSETEDLVRHYRLQRTVPGSTIRASTVTRLPQEDGRDLRQLRHWQYTISTADGVECSSKWAHADDLSNAGVLLSGTALSLPYDPRLEYVDKDKQACAEATDLVLQLERGSEKQAEPMPIEIVVLEEDPVPDVPALPEGVTDIPSSSTGLEYPPPGTPVKVIGGASFNDALEIAPGTYETEVVPGEMLFFRSLIGWGHSAVYSIDGPAPDSAAMQATGTTPTPDYILIGGNVYAPDRSQMDSQELWKHGIWRKYGGGKIDAPSSPEINVVPEVRYRNRWDSKQMYFRASRGFSMAGDYYFTVAVPGDSDTPEGVPLPVRFTLAVDGEATDVTGRGEPTPTPSPTPSPSPFPTTTSPAPTAATQPPVDDAKPDEREASGVSPLTIGGVALIGLGLAGGAVYLARRRGSDQAEHE